MLSWVGFVIQPDFSKMKVKLDLCGQNSESERKKQQMEYNRGLLQIIKRYE